MQKLSLVVVSALVLGLGISVFADQQPTAPASARAAGSARFGEAGCAGDRRCAHARVDHRITNRARQAGLRDLPQRSQQEQRGRTHAAEISTRRRSDTTQHVADVAEKMIRKLRSGMMPPAGARRPEPQVINAFATSMETRLDQAADLNPNPGHRPFQRLNRAEYARAVHALLALDVDVSAFLPPDQISAGFDNVADSQTLLGHADGRLPAGGQPHQRAGGRRPEGRGDGDHLQGAAHRLADAARRRHAVRHARRHPRDAHVPRGRRVLLPHAAAFDSHRPAVRQHGARRIARGLASTASGRRSSRSTRA